MTSPKEHLRQQQIADLQISSISLCSIPQAAGDLFSPMVVMKRSTAFIAKSTIGA